MSSPPSPRQTAAHDRVADASAHLRSSIIQPVLDVVGDRWTFNILAALLAGMQRFDLLQNALGIARSTLSSRLEDLVHHGLAERRRYQDNPPRDDYVLTRRGRDVLPIVLLIQRWDAVWGPEEDAGPGPEIVHRACGNPLRPRLVCRTCQQTVRMRDVAYAKGPGFLDEALPSLQRRPRRRSAPGADTAELLNAEDILGDRWTALIVATAFFGLRRFSDMQAALGIAPNILAQRLAQLTGCGIFARHVYQDRPRRAQYILTEKGLDLYPLTLSLMAWGDAWLVPEAGPPLVLTHRPCGHTLKPVLACAACDEVAEAASLHVA